MKHDLENMSVQQIKDAMFAEVNEILMADFVDNIEGPTCRHESIHVSHIAKMMQGDKAEENLFYDTFKSLRGLGRAPWVVTMETNFKDNTYSTFLSVTCRKPQTKPKPVEEKKK